MLQFGSKVTYRPPMPGVVDDVGNNLAPARFNVSARAFNLVTPDNVSRRNPSSGGQRRQHALRPPRSGRLSQRAWAIWDGDLVG